MSSDTAAATPMVYTYLGRTGIKVSNICLGTMTFGVSQEKFFTPNQCDETASHEIIERYVDLGGNFLDTANIYRHGESESIIGRWLERRKRDNYVIATKVRGDMGTTEDINNAGLSRRHITRSLDRSLERLHTDYVDLYQTHLWDSGTPIEETLRTLDDLVRCGKVRYVGASNLTGWQLQTVVVMTEKLELNPLVSLQQQYSLLSRFSEVDSFPVCKLQGLGVLPWSPLKGGLLSGKYQRGTTPSEGRIAWVHQDRTRMNEAGPVWADVDDKTFDVMETTNRIAQKIGRSPAQVAIRWLLQKDVVSSVVIGASKVSQVADNMKASGGWSLSHEEMQQLDDVSELPLPYPYTMCKGLNKHRINHFLPLDSVSNTTP